MRILIVLLFVVCCTLSLYWLPSSSGPARRAAAADGAAEAKTGLLTIVRGVSLPGEPDGMTMHFLLAGDDGETLSLMIDEPVLAAAGGARAVDRRRVTVTGQRELRADGAPAMFFVESISYERTAKDARGEAPAEQVVGPRPFVNILCRFADATGTTPQPPSFFTGLFVNARPGLDHFYRDISYNNITLAGTQTVGWFDLPQPRSYYFTADPPNFQRMAADCTAQADAAIDFRQFQGINLIFNQNFGCCAWGGAQGLTLDGVTRAWPMTWMPPGGFFQSIFAHEMGHSFGWGHSANALGTTYASGWDAMSRDRYNSGAATDPTYGSIGQNTIAMNLDLAGWIPVARKFTAAGGTTTTINLERTSQPGASGYLLATIPYAANKFYTVEARSRTSYDAKLPNEAVVIHGVDTTRLDDAWTVDPDGNADPMDAGGQWLPGETFTDAANGVTVTVNAATATGFNVTISRAGPSTANFAVAGRVADASGRGLANAQVTLVYADGATRVARTNPFGYYRFANVPAGGPYTATAVRKNRGFAAQTINLAGNLTALNFTAE